MAFCARRIVCSSSYDGQIYKKREKDEAWSTDHSQLKGWFRVACFSRGVVDLPLDGLRIRSKGQFRSNFPMFFFLLWRRKESDISVTSCKHICYRRDQNIIQLIICSPKRRNDVGIRCHRLRYFSLLPLDEHGEVRKCPIHLSISALAKLIVQLQPRGDHLAHRGKKTRSFWWEPIKQPKTYV